MWDTLIDTAGILALALIAFYILRFIIPRPPTHHNPTPHFHMRIVPQVDGIAYAVTCHTGPCGWHETYDDLPTARRAIEDHLTDPRYPHHDTEA